MFRKNAEPYKTYKNQQHKMLKKNKETTQKKIFKNMERPNITINISE
jgi:hypothetical protein